MTGRAVQGNAGHRIWRTLVIALAASATAPLAVSASALAAPASRSAGARTPRVRVLRTASVDHSALTQLFARHAGTSRSAIGLAPDSVRAAVVVATGRQWAIARFRPASHLTVAQQVALQDGASTGIFTRAGAGRAWTLAARGIEPLACDAALPSAVRAAWRLSPGCGAASSHALAEARSQVAGTTTFGSRIASIALSQVGEADLPPSTNFAVDCDPYTTLDGPEYSAPSGRGCEFDSHFGVENENEEWCSDFAEWVWREAGITQDMDLINPGANSFYAWGAAQGQPLTIDGTDPQVGDAVVFYEPGAVKVGTSADHVGIVSGVNANGTVDLVDGDFSGPTNTSVQYNSDVDLKTWASEVWSPGEQWVFVAPPTGAQPATPTASVSGPHVVAAGTEATFSTSAQQAGGSIASETWSFGSGNGVPNGYATGATVHHVFADAGRHSVTMIADSSLHTITVRTYDVDVVAPSQSVASTPSDAVYYNDGPVSQHEFSVSSAGALSQESFDGESWLDEALPGSWSPATPLTTLDSKVLGVLSPHVYGRSASGTLQEAYPNGATWTVQTLAGSPAPGSPIVAADTVGAGADGAAPAYAEAFFFDAAGQLQQSSDASGHWIVSSVPWTRGDHGLAIGTIDVGGTPALTVYTRSWSGALLALTEHGRWWSVARVAGARQVARHSALTAVDSGDAGDPGVFFVDRAGRVEAAAPGPFGFGWRSSTISAQPTSASGGLSAAEVGTATGTAVDEVAALSPAGAPQLLSDASGSWSTQTLPGSATTLLGLGAYALPGAPQNVIVQTAQGVQADTAASAAGPWTAQTLPATTATFPDRVLLYAADPADLAAAQAAAVDAGLAPSQVTGSFADAWAAGISGDYLVIAVGDPASSALYVNSCGWSDPSGTFPGSTPYNNITTPTDSLPGADVFLQADGASAQDTATLAEDLADYAVHGALPSGATLPAQAAISGACAGSADAS